MKKSYSIFLISIFPHIRLIFSQLYYLIMAYPVSVAEIKAECTKRINAYITIKIDLLALLISAIFNTVILGYRIHHFLINHCYNLACISTDGVEIIKGNASTYLSAERRNGNTRNAPIRYANFSLSVRYVLVCF